jgi:hypothetical protein
MVSPERSGPSEPSAAVLPARRHGTVLKAAGGDTPLRNRCGQGFGNEQLEGYKGYRTSLAHGPGVGPRHVVAIWHTIATRPREHRQKA